MTKIAPLTDREEKAARTLGYIRGACPECNGHGWSWSDSIGPKDKDPCWCCGELGVLYATEFHWESMQRGLTWQPKNADAIRKLLENSDS